MDSKYNLVALTSESLALNPVSGSMCCARNFKVSSKGFNFPFKTEKNFQCFALDSKYPMFYYPPCDIFALNTGKYRPESIFFLYTGTLVLWIMSVNNLHFFQQPPGKYVTYIYV